MDKEKDFFIIESNVLPEVFMKVMRAKTILENGEAKTVQEAAKMANISRSAFYRYKDSIFPFYQNMRGRTITVALGLSNESGVLSNVLNMFARESANILTINQNIPINNIANVTITIETKKVEKDIMELFNLVQDLKGVKNFKIIARE